MIELTDREKKRIIKVDELDKRVEQVIDLLEDDITRYNISQTLKDDLLKILRPKEINLPEMNDPIFLLDEMGHHIGTGFFRGLKENCYHLSDHIGCGWPESTWSIKHYTWQHAGIRKYKYDTFADWWDTEATSKNIKAFAETSFNAARETINEKAETIQYHYETYKEFNDFECYRYIKESDFNTIRSKTNKPVETKKPYELELIDGMPCLVRDSSHNPWQRGLFEFKKTLNSTNPYWATTIAEGHSDFRYAIPFNEKLLNKVDEDE